MPRVVIIHWKPEEAAEKTAALKAQRFDVAVQRPEAGAGLRPLRDNPPDALVIDLTRLPSHGKEIAGWWRSGKATREVPLVFVGGEEEKVAKIRSLFPDATYCTWRGLPGAIRRALKTEPGARPVSPGTLAGYSGTPLSKKLGIKPGTTVSLMYAPGGFEQALEPLPEGVRVATTRTRANRVLLFVRSRKELADSFHAAALSVEHKGALWIVWPKKASGIVSDLSEPSVREFGLAAGWVDYKVCAVDATWSGLQFAPRAISSK